MVLDTGSTSERITIGFNAASGEETGFFEVGLRPVDDAFAFEYIPYIHIFNSDSG
jgi:hypothetical protein